MYDIDKCVSLLLYFQAINAKLHILCSVASEQRWCIHLLEALHDNHSCITAWHHWKHCVYHPQLKTLLSLATLEIMLSPHSLKTLIIMSSCMHFYKFIQIMSLHYNYSSTELVYILWTLSMQWITAMQWVHGSIECSNVHATSLKECHYHYFYMRCTLVQSVSCKLSPYL